MQEEPLGYWQHSAAQCSTVLIWNLIYHPRALSIDDNSALFV